MSDTELALDAASSLEMLLAAKFGAEGKGLHEKVTSIESKLDPILAKKIRFIATVRNGVVHERRKIENPTDFAAAAQEAIAGLTNGQMTSPAEVIAYRHQDPNSPAQQALQNFERFQALVNKKTWLDYVKAAYMVFVAIFSILGFIGGFQNGYDSWGMGAGVVLGVIGAVFFGVLAYYAWVLALVGGAIYAIITFWGTKL